MGKIFHRRLAIRFSHVDWARIVYFPRLFDLLHGVMEDFFAEAVERPYRAMLEEEGIGFPTVHFESDFSRPLPFGREIEVAFTVVQLGRSKVVFRYQVVLEGESETAAEVRQTVVAVDMSTWRSMEIPELYRAAFERFFSSSSCHGS